MNGIYRQSHPAIHTWLGEGDFRFESYLAAGRLTFASFDLVNAWSFGIVEGGDLYAFCVIDEEADEITDELEELIYSPWLCNEWWAYDEGYDRSAWINDEMMDVDLCDEDENEIVPNVTYDELVCFMPENYDGEHSHYQGLFGLYELNGDYIDRDVFDGRPFYNQQRLDDVDDGKWHILWFDEHDSWVINDYIPHDTVAMGGHVFYYESWCSHTLTPANCSDNWPLYQGYTDIDVADSDVIMFAVEEGSTEAANCMPEVHDAIVVTESATLCFDDNVNAEADNPLSGEYVLSTGDTYNDRHYWIKDAGTDDVMYLFYDAPKRFWVIDDTLGDQSYFTSPDFEVYCLLWDDLQPFDCHTWYFYNTTATEMPGPKKTEQRVTQYLTMSTGECAVSADAATANVSAAGSAGAIVGYVIGALILLLILALLYFGKCCACKPKGQFSFATGAAAGTGASMASSQAGGIGGTSGGTAAVQMETIDVDALPATAGGPDVVRNASVTMDGDMNETK
jgi:hypothetical protein